MNLERSKLSSSPHSPGRLQHILAVSVSACPLSSPLSTNFSCLSTSCLPAGTLELISSVEVQMLWSPFQACKSCKCGVRSPLSASKGAKVLKDQEAAPLDLHAKPGPGAGDPLPPCPRPMAGEALRGPCSPGNDCPACFRTSPGPELQVTYKQDAGKLSRILFGQNRQFWTRP